MTVRARAPLRLGLAGGGTDVSPYCDRFGGQVMNATIDRYAYAIVRASDDGNMVFRALDMGLEEVCQGLVSAEPGGPLQLLKGVHRRMRHEFLHDEMVPLQISTFSDAPPGSGLGSSSTLVVALVQAYAEYFSLPLGEYEVARLAWEIERNDLALAGGKQDQYAATFGGFNFMEFHADGQVIVNPLRIKDWVWAELEASLVLYFTGVSRASAQIIDQQSKQVTADNARSIDAMHRLKKEAVAMKECVLKGNLDRLAEVLREGWRAKKETANAISNPLIEHIESVAQANGARAAKVSGAGGGGFMMFLCHPEERIALVNALKAEGGTVMDFHFIQQGATAWRVP